MCDDSRICVWVPVVGLAVALLVGVWIRIHYLHQPIKYDEAVSLALAEQPLAQIIQSYGSPNNHILHSILAHMSMRQFGPSEWAMRLPALLAGIGMIPAAWLLGRKLFGAEAATGAAILTAGSSAAVDYSTNARGYTLIALIYLLLLLLVEWITRANPRGTKRVAAWAGFVMLSAMGFYTIPVMLFPFGAAICWMVVEALRRRRRLMLMELACAVVATAGLTLLLYLPVISNNAEATALFSNRFITPLSFRKFSVRVPPMICQTWALWTRDMPKVIVSAVVMGMIAATVSSRGSRRAGLLVLMLSVAWCLIVMLLQRVVPFPRTWLFLLPVIFATASAGIAIVLRVILRDHFTSFVASTSLIVMLGGWLAWRTYASDSPIWSPETGSFPAAPLIARDLLQRAGPADRLITHIPADEPMQYYCRRAGISPELWNSRLGNAPLIWAVVNESTMSLDGLIQANHIVRSNYKKPVKIREYAGAALYGIALRKAPTTAANRTGIRGEASTPEVSQTGFRVTRTSNPCKPYPAQSIRFALLINSYGKI